MIDSNINGSEAIVKSLLNEGVNTIFGYPGGAIMPLYDALYKYQKLINHILVRHEQGAVHAAQGYARITQNAGVCIATSGPGAINLMTGIADAMMDSTPLICITGQVNESLLGTDAFQEADIISMTLPITKWNYQIVDANEIPYILSKAFFITSNGKPGPVLIDITKNAQLSILNNKFSHYKKYYHNIKNINKKIKHDNIFNIANEINNAQRPYLLAGNGILISKAQNVLKKFIDKTGIPVAVTLLGLSAFPHDHPKYVGMLGMHGNYSTNKMIQEADLIIGIGMRFDDRVTGNVNYFAKNAKIIHIDINESEIKKVIKNTHDYIVGDAFNIINMLLPLVAKKDHIQWINKFKTLDKEEKKHVIDSDINPQNGDISMGEVINMLSIKTKGNAIIVADVGQHQMYAARYYKYLNNNSYITSGGLGTMGFAIPASLGVQIGSPNQQVIVIVGDGGFQMTMQELGTISQYKLPIKIIILNNQYLGMVRQWQQLFFEKRYSFVSMQNPDFCKIADGFNIKNLLVKERHNLSNALDKMINSKEAFLLTIFVGKELNVFPMVPTGSSVSDIRLK
ncbi:MAG: biosynthetic-type acetolactate synthase large subunit [Bacteroides sp.]|nr:MAG: biosynthetic-type acetolactate synthase large subunit [Bacteroides sp.]